MTRERPWIASVSRKWLAASLFFVLLGPATLVVLTTAAEREPYRSPFDLAFSPDGTMLAVSDRTAGRLYVLDVQAGQVAKEVALHGRPMGLAWQGDDKVVVSEYDGGTVAEVDAKTGQVLRRFAVGPKPVGVAVAPNKGLLVVCDYGLHAVSIVELKTGRERTRVSCGKHPYFVAVTPDEQMAVVGHLIPAGTTYQSNRNS